MNLRKIIPLVIFFMLIIFLSILLVLWDSNRQNQISTKAGNMMYDAIFTNASEIKATTILTKAIQENSNYKYLAQFKLANIYSSKVNLVTALDIYSNLADNNKLLPILNQLAKYFKTIILIKTGPQNQQAIYNSLTNEVYSSSTQEVSAIYKLRNNEVKHAIDILNSIINDEYFPLPVKKNAKELLQIALANH